MDLIDFENRDLYWALIQYGLVSSILGITITVSVNTLAGMQAGIGGLVLVFVYRLIRQLATDWDKELDTWEELFPLIAAWGVSRISYGSMAVIGLFVIFLLSGVIGYFALKE
jgi:hypothetical protein